MDNDSQLISGLKELLRKAEEDKVEYKDKQQKYYTKTENFIKIDKICLLFKPFTLMKNGKRLTEIMTLLVKEKEISQIQLRKRIGCYQNRRDWISRDIKLLCAFGWVHKLKNKNTNRIVLSPGFEILLK